MMKYIYTFFLFSILLFVFPLPNTYAEETKPTLIQTYHADVTGDNKLETIKLLGTLFSSGSTYYREIWAEISNEQNQWQIIYPGGYDPSLQFIDLNHDGIKDIFYQSATGGSGGLYSYQLNTILHTVLQRIPLPEQTYLSGSFQPNFKVNIQLTATSKPIKVDVQPRAEDYIRLGIYNKEGNLISENKSVMIDPIAFFEPIKISASKGYGLKSYQQISGAYHADQLGTVETIWYFENDNWIIIKTDWVPSI
ncbi:hypothetical protein [Virgibacillus sp. 6R]|uniref:hypothetical protein n=2 Tax=unclassified Virgibacillus TaxID=2620237 RepID=UPI000909F769|nr:hypothetical protein [Virgibacillus sp. 6R]API90892.1 hypothetical protein BKP57_02895 [Virgibacillus sp. 6R]